MENEINIILVDDEPSLLDQAKIFLEKGEEKLNVITASSAEQGLDLLDDEDIDVIVSDYQMPEIDGLEFLRKIREKRELDIPFIMFTGKGREEVAMEALNLGADRYLQKGGDPKSQYGVLAQAIMQEYEHHQSDKKYRTVVENSHDAVYIYKGDDLLFVNEKATEVTGYGREELYDMKLWDLLHPEDRERVEELAEKRRRGEKVPSSYNAQIITKEGETKHLHLTVTPIQFKGQRAFLGSARDITELKAAQEEREEYIDELKFLNDVMLNVPRMKSIDEICDYIAEKVHSLNQENSVIVALYDQEIEAIRVRTLTGLGEYQQMIEDRFISGEEKITFDPEVLDEWEEIFRSGDLERMPQGLYSLVKGVLSKEESKKLEELLGVKEVYSVGFALDKKPYGGITILKSEKGEPRFKSAIESIASHLSVIMHKKQHEKRLRLSDFSLEQASQEIYWITPDGKFIFVNETVSKRLGYSKEELTDMYIWDIDPNQIEDIRGERWEKLKEEGVLSFESEHKTKDGEVYPVEIKTNYLEFDGREYEFAFAEDITEEKRKEKELGEERNFIEQIAETSPVCITKVDREGKITFANDKAEEVLGLSKSEIRGRTYDDPAWKITDYDGEEYLVEELSFELVKEKGEAVHDVRHAIEWPDGERKLLTINAAPLYDERGNFDGMVATIDDITEVVEKERELEESRERLDTLLSHTPAVIYTYEVTDGTPQTTYVSESVVDVLGHEPEYYTSDQQNFLDNLHPEDSQKLFEKEEKLLTEEDTDSITLEYRFKDKEGDYHWLHDEQKILVEEDDRQKVIGAWWDITERKKADIRIRKTKEKLEKLQQASADLETCQSKEDVYTLAIEVAEDILEFDWCVINTPEKDRLVTKKASGDYPEEESSYLLIEDSVAGTAFLKNKSFLNPSISELEEASPTHDDYRSGITVPIGKFGVFQAISSEEDDFDEDDLTIAELLMDHVNEALNRIEARETEEFLHSMLRHDLKNKSNIVQGYLQLVEEHDLEEEVESLIGKAIEANKEEKEMIEKVRKLREVEELEKESVDLVQVIEDVIEENRDIVEDFELEIETDLTSCEIKGGPFLGELFENLVDNSIKHSDGDLVKISIEEKENVVLCRVEDNGKGIPDEMKDKIFERGFKKGENAGSGLGMYLVKEIVDGYDGSIEVKDSELGGARFDVHLIREGEKEPVEWGCEDR